MVRVARMSPSLTLAEIAARSGPSPLPLTAVLTPRGRCAALNVAAVGDGTDSCDDALTQRACPPFIVRSAKVPTIAATTAAWRSRRVSDAGADSRLLRRCAAWTASHHLRQRAGSNSACPPAVLAALVRDNDYRIQRSAAANPACALGAVLAAALATERGGLDVVLFVTTSEKAAANPAVPQNDAATLRCSAISSCEPEPPRTPTAIRGFWLFSLSTTTQQCEPKPR